MTREHAPQLLEAARAVADHAHVPYSGFPVGAALLTEDGQVITGCNVENASFGLTVCAERVAIGKAVSEGHRKFVAIAIWAKKAAPCTPCGACRQVLAEFAPKLTVILANGEGPGPGMEAGSWHLSLEELLPHQFSASVL